MRLAPPAGGRAGGIVVDLLFASSGVEPEVVSAAKPLEVLVRGIRRVSPTQVLAHDLDARLEQLERHGDGAT